MTLDGKFYWWHVADGVATAHPDSPVVQELINSGDPHWYGSIEGCIKHGGVQATAFNRIRTKLYDAAEFFRSGEFIEAGARLETIVTFSHEPQLRRHRYESPL